MRLIAASVFDGLGSDVMPQRQSTTSKLPSGKSIRSASTSRNSTLLSPSEVARSRAKSSIRGETSVATTRPAGPARLAASRAGSPIPVATSRTRWPGRTSARSSIRSLTHCAPFSIVRHHFRQPAATLSHCRRWPSSSRVRSSNWALMDSTAFFVAGPGPAVSAGRRGRSCSRAEPIRREPIRENLRTAQSYHPSAAGLVDVPAEPASNP